MDSHYHNCWTHCAAEWWQYGTRAAIWTLIKIKAVSPRARLVLRHWIFELGFVVFDQK